VRFFDLCEIGGIDKEFHIGELCIKSRKEKDMLG
jgi:hypothetical protein